MITSQPVKVRVCGLEDLQPGAACRVEVASQRVALVRIGDDFYAIGDTCSHADVSLSEGDVLIEDRELECWKHGSTFSLVTGEPSCLPAVRPVAVYEVQVIGEDVYVVLPTAVTENARSRG